VSYAWDCKTHAYIAKRAGIRIPEAACMPDIIRDENHDLLGPFHYHDAAPNTIVTADYIDRFKVSEVNIQFEGNSFRVLVPHPAGILYWKIVDLYEKMKNLDRTKPDNQLAYEYYMVTIAHFVGDLSQPLHNFPYADKPSGDGKVYEEEGKFNRDYHYKFDEAFSYYLNNDPNIHSKINEHIKNIDLKSTEQLKNEISAIANSAIKIANQCYLEKRMPSEDELLKQVSWSISLLMAIIKSTN